MDGYSTPTNPPEASKRTVVITGMGVTTAIGDSPVLLWQNVIAQRSGISRITRFDCAQSRTQIAGLIENFPWSKYVTARERETNGLATQYAIYAAHEAYADAQLCGQAYDAWKGAVFWGTGYGCLDVVSHEMTRFAGNGRVSPYFIPMVMHNAPAFEIAKRLQMRGANVAISTACSSSANAIGAALQAIRDGVADVAIAGGSETPVTSFSLQAWCELRGAMSTNNDDPERSCRPFSLDRDGLVLGEGAGAIVIEELQNAIRRGARIYGELAGYGASCDTVHVTLPSVDAQAAALQNAIADAHLELDEIDYINAHGTGTKANDKIETEAIKQVLGIRAPHVAINSSKPLIGHLIGASGAVELIIGLLCMQNSIVHSTINYTLPDPDCDLDYVIEGPRPRELRSFLSNSFAFGGSNAVLAVRRHKISNS